MQTWKLAGKPVWLLSLLVLFLLLSFYLADLTKFSALPLVVIMAVSWLWQDDKRKQFLEFARTTRGKLWAASGLFVFLSSIALSGLDLELYSFTFLMWFALIVIAARTPTWKPKTAGATLIFAVWLFALIYFKPQDFTFVPLLVFVMGLLWVQGYDWAMRKEPESGASNHTRN